MCCEKRRRNLVIDFPEIISGFHLLLLLRDLLPTRAGRQRSAVQQVNVAVTPTCLVSRNDYKLSEVKTLLLRTATVRLSASVCTSDVIDCVMCGERDNEFFFLLTVEIAVEGFNPELVGESRFVFVNVHFEMSLNEDWRIIVDILQLQSHLNRVPIQLQSFKRINK